MDTTIRLRACVTMAVAAVLALAPAITRAAADSDARGPAPRVPASKAPTAKRPHQASRLASSPPAAATTIAPAPAGPFKPLDLTLTPAEIHAILGRYPGDAGDGAHSAFDDVMVTAATELQPMRDPVHEVWGGIGAPVWALLHPTQAWRIFLPIPPK